MKIRLKIKDSRELRDSVENLKRELAEKKAFSGNKKELLAAKGYQELKKALKDSVKGLDAKIKQLDRLHARAPEKNGRNDAWVSERLLEAAKKSIADSEEGEVEIYFNLDNDIIWSVDPDSMDDLTIIPEGWITKAQWEDFLSKATDKGWASWEELLKQSKPEEIRKAKAKDAEKPGRFIVYCDYRANELGDFWISEEGFQNADEMDANDMFEEDKSKAHKFSSVEEIKRFCEENGIEDFEILDIVKAKDEAKIYAGEFNEATKREIREELMSFAEEIGKKDTGDLEDMLREILAKHGASVQWLDRERKPVATGKIDFLMLGWGDKAGSKIATIHIRPDSIAHDMDELAEDLAKSEARNAAFKDAVVNPVGSLAYDEKVEKDIEEALLEGCNADLKGNIEKVFKKHGIEAEKIKVEPDWISVDWSHKGFTGYNEIRLNVLEADVRRFAEDLAGAIYKKSLKRDSEIEDGEELEGNDFYFDVFDL